MKPKYGLIHGRFSPLHLGHMEYILAGRERCEILIIGITNSDPSLAEYNQADPKRTRRSANAITFFERSLIIRECLLEAGVKLNEFLIVPFPINRPELLPHYAPANATFFITIYDDWGRYKRDTLISLGLRVEVMWERSMEQRLTSGTQIRGKMGNNEPWEHLVPNACKNILIELGIDKKISDLVKDELRAQ